MAEYQEVMRQWRRMCKKNQTDCTRSCPIGANLACGDLSVADDEDIRKAETAIMAWAAEHPEPVYPTWWKYMCMIGVIPNTLGDKTLGEVTVERLMHTSIPADIAEKLGLKPKEARP